MKKLLIIGLVWPEPTSSAAGWRILQLVKLFATTYQVHFASAASKSPYSFDLEQINVTTHNILLNDSPFDQFMRELQPDVVIFDRFMIEEQYAWRVSTTCPQAIRILDTEDLHFLRQAREQAYKKQQPVQLKNDTCKRELASILRSDLSLMISESEIELLQNTFHIDRSILQFIPFQEEKLIENVDTKRKSFAERSNFVFIGNFLHEPNWKTVEILKRTVWPVLRKKLPAAELHIYGAYPSEKVLQLNKPQERFFIKGRAEDARLTLEDYRVLLAPIPFGAGMKGKFVDAMYSGTPCITTSVGAEAMLYKHEWNGFIADDPALFIQRAEVLYDNEGLWQSKQKNGFNLFNHNFANLVHSKILLEKVNSLLENLNNHREQNFLGQVLLHHTLQSSKYMSMWIEEKNRKIN